MKRLALLLCCCMLLSAAALAEPALRVDAAEPAWSWEAGSQQKLIYTLTVGSEQLTDVTLSLSPVVSDGAEAGQAVWVLKDNRPIAKKDQTAELTMGSLDAGSTHHMTAAWLPPEPLYDVKEASWTLTAVAEAGGRTVTASKVVRVRQESNNRGIGNVIVAGGWPVSRIAALLGFALLLIAVLACVRIVRVRNRTVRNG